MTALQITDEVYVKATRFDLHPFDVAYFDQYVTPGWSMSVGRDNGYLYDQAGHMIGFALSREAWHFNLFWKKEPMVPQTIILCDVSLPGMVEKLYAKPRFPPQPYQANPHRK